MRFEDRVKAIIGVLEATSPEVDTSPLSIIRTLIDATAETGAQADAALSDVLDWDLGKLRGEELDDFVSIFGFRRITGTFATGYVTLKFGIPVSRDYLIQEGTAVHARRGGRERVYVVPRTIVIPRGSSFLSVPVVASRPGPAYNAGPGELNILLIQLEQFVSVGNPRPVTGGRPEENDALLIERFRKSIFRSNIGTESYYKDVALRSSQISAAQLIKPSQEVEEHLQIKDGAVQCQEDSIKFVYSSNPSVYMPTMDIWLEEGRDFDFITDNANNVPPTFRFKGDNWEEGDLVAVRYRYCSDKSRNDPIANVFNYLDLYIRGNQPFPSIDFSSWPRRHEVGDGTITLETHPNARPGRPYYVFLRQPVREVASEMVINGVSYTLGRDYILAKDETSNANSMRARDCLVWLTGLPFGSPTPAFDVPYFHDSVVSDVQRVIDAPEGHGAIDDVLVHGATEMPLDIHVVVEWERGLEDANLLRERLEEFLSGVEMGGSIKVGIMLHELQRLRRVASISLGQEGIVSPNPVRGTNNWRHHVPLPDGAVPILGKLKLDRVASNTYDLR